MADQLTYERKGDKIVLCKDGVYMGLTLEQLIELKVSILPKVMRYTGLGHWELRGDKWE